MSEALKQIDQELIDLEDRLLIELRRLRKLDSDEVYSAIDPVLHEELKLNYSALLDTLIATGDWANLSLKSEEHEWIEARMKVARNLLVRKLPTAFLSASHQEQKATSKSQFGTDAHYAAEELAILDQQVASHQVDGRTIEDILKERAQFTSRELSTGHAQELRTRGSSIAKTPDEIRRKLQGSEGTLGPSTFTSRDLGGSNPIPPAPKSPPAAEPKAGLAQSPDEIRRKLAARQADSQGKASFGSKDIESLNDRAPASRTETKQDTAPAPSTPPGKAVFGAKDIEPISEKVNKKDESPPKPKAGPATFESRDLSDPKR